MTYMNDDQQALVQSSEGLTRASFAAQRLLELENLCFDSLAEAVDSIPSGAQARTHALHGLEAFRSRQFSEAESAFDKAKEAWVAGLDNHNAYAALCAFHAYSMWFCEGVSAHERIEAAQHLYQKACEIWLNLGEYGNIAVHQRALASMFFISNRLPRAKIYFGASLNLANTGKVTLEPAIHKAWADDYQNCSDLCELC